MATTPAGAGRRRRPRGRKLSILTDLASRSLDRREFGVLWERDASTTTSTATSTYLSPHSPEATKPTGSAFAAENAYIIGILISEMINMPEPRRTDLRRMQNEYIFEWINLMRQTRPALLKETTTLATAILNTPVPGRRRHRRTKDRLTDDITSHAWPSLMNPPAAIRADGWQRPVHNERMKWECADHE